MFQQATITETSACLSHNKSATMRCVILMCCLPRPHRASLQAPADLGDIQRVRVRTDARGLGAAWHLSHVGVVSSATNTTCRFSFNNW